MAIAPEVPEPDLSAGPAAASTDAAEVQPARLHAPAERPRPVVLASYDGTRRQPNLTALLALLLKRYGVAVCVHGAPPKDAAPRLTTADVLLELGIEPAVDIGDAQARLVRDDIAYVPLDVLAPDVAARATPALVRLLDPFGGDGYRVIGARDASERALLREVLVATRANALLLDGAEGEPFADPAEPWQFESFAAGIATASGAEGARGPFLRTPAGDAASTAAAIERVLAGELPVPDSLLAELGACLAGVRRSA